MKGETVQSRGLWVLLAIALCTTIASARVDESTLKARVLYLGDASYPPNKLVLEWILAEPKFPVVIVPCDTYFISLPEATRLTRLYLPRTYQTLNSTTDLFVIHNISPTIIPKKVLGFLQGAVEDDGLGAGLISFMFWGGGAGTNDIGVWMTLSFYDVFPADVDVTKDIPSMFGRTFWKVVKRRPILDLPDIEKQAMQSLGNHGGDIWPRTGSVTHAVWKGRGTPVMVTGTYGSGRTLQLGQGWHNPPTIGTYRYMPDLIYNHLYFLADVSPPEDLELAHRAREMFIDARIRKSVTISTIEFVGRFGAKVGEIEDTLAGLDPIVEGAESRYLAGDFAATSEILTEVMETYPRIEERVTKLKNQTMMWIYFFEWVVVASTGMICGVVIWALMVRRSLYRDMGTTRLSPAPDS